MSVFLEMKLYWNEINKSQAPLTKRELAGLLIEHQKMITELRTLQAQYQKDKLSPLTDIAAKRLELKADIYKKAMESQKQRITTSGSERVALLDNATKLATQAEQLAGFDFVSGIRTQLDKVIANGLNMRSGAFNKKLSTQPQVLANHNIDAIDNYIKVYLGQEYQEIKSIVNTTPGHE
jgi:hypothetical protein